MSGNRPNINLTSSSSPYTNDVSHYRIFIAATEEVFYIKNGSGNLVEAMRPKAIKLINDIFQFITDYVKNATPTTTNKPMGINGMIAFSPTIGNEFICVEVFNIKNEKERMRMLEILTKIHKDVLDGLIQNFQTTHYVK